METSVEVEIAHGDTKEKVRTPLFLPEGEGPFPLVVFYVDAGGLRPAMSIMAEPLVARGYAVLQPDPYWRLRPYAPFDATTVFQDPPERARLMAMVKAVRSHDVFSDTMLYVEQLATEPRVRSDVFGCLGYCMGGRLAFQAASALSNVVVASACIHPGGLVTDAPDSPHRDVARIRGRIYLGIADQDGSCTPEHQTQLHEALGMAGVRYELELYPGALHGFAVPDFPVYNAEAAERHWQRVLALFERTLKVDRLR